MSLLLLLLSSSAWAAWPGTSSWVPLAQGGTPITDGAQDMTGTDESTDLVGTTTNAAGYWFTDGDTVWFRLRLNETPEQGGGIRDLQDHGWGVALNTDSDLSNFEYVVAVDQLTGVLTLRQNVDGSAGPDATSTIISTESRRGLDDDLVRVVSAGSTIDGDSDFYLDFQVTVASLKRDFGLADNTVFRMAMLTADDGAENMDADVAGWPNLTDLSKGWTDETAIDRDGDGLTAPEEALIGTDPTDADSDDDGIYDGIEASSPLDPLACDSDGDDLPDGLEFGVASDKIDVYTDLAAMCFLPDTDTGTTTDGDDNDTDGGGVDDGDEDWNRDGAVGEWEIDPNLRADDVDSDSDGIWDVLEAKCPEDGGAIVDADSDGDGIDDATEWLVDTDGDGWPDFCDTDSDGDGIDDATEGEVDTDEDGTPDYRDDDSDGDGKSDEDEGTGDNDGDGIPNYTDPDDEDGPDGDRDADGITNADEDDCGSDPDDADSDKDGIPDGDEYPCDTDSDCDGTIDVLDPTDDDLCDTDETDDTDDTGAPAGPGSYTGGSCSSASTGPALPLALLGALGLAGFIRRRRRFAAISLAAGSTAVVLPIDAQAQDADTTINAQRFRPARDGARFFSVDDTEVGEAWTPGGALIFNYADDPLVYRYADETKEEARLLGHVGTLDLVASFNLPGVRLGVDLPLHLTSSGEGVDGFRLIGDARLSAGGELIRRQPDGGFGFGVEGRLDLPTGNGEARLGHGRTTAGLGLMGSYEAGPVLIATNLGFGTGTGQAFPDDVSLGPNLDYALGAAVDLTPTVGLSAEVLGETYLSKQSGAAGASPAEILGGVRWRPAGDLVVSLGGGTGLSQGVGSPDYRLLLGIGLSPRADNKDRVAGINDRDGDGIPDEIDLCPGQPEDFNGIDDGDGCPDGNLTPTRIKVMDDRGNLIANSVVALTSGPGTGSFTLTDGEMVRSLEPGKYGVRVSCDGYLPTELDVKVPKQRSHEQVVRLDRMISSGTLVVTARNDAGLPVPASVRVLGPDGRRAPGEPDGVVEMGLPPGSYNVVVSADGYGNVEKAVTIEEKGTVAVEVVMPAGKVKIEGDRVLILDKVYFELNSAQIKQDSFGLLDEVAATLINHPELELLEVQGHTDQQGSATYNQGLSEKRAAAVRTYLITQGVGGERLTAKGYGESQPLINETNQEAYAANRRVEFHIVRRSDAR